MSYTYLPETPRTRPAVVTAAVALLWVAVGVLVIDAVAALALAGLIGWWRRT